jgi:hypothetical protein
MCASHLVEAQRAQLLPVLDRHARRRGTQLLGDRAQRSLARPKPSQLAPSPLLDRSDQFAVPAFGTQKLCVGLRSVVAILGRGGYRRDHLALGPRKRARREHDLHEQLRQRRADQRMGVH